ncbi:hypothetical protein GV64_04490 [Endozoicomonas elysicola]|uniref:Uncharacterized protein n=1 Tax=Endozoicomonas elysicola TaxID=305900 RepID=A0A081K7H8_9GAMM|nr:hypothetical protein GV64_04490 [Endozoicomonas elysicola]
MISLHLSVDNDDLAQINHTFFIDLCGFERQLLSFFNESFNGRSKLLNTFKVIINSSGLITD